MPTCSLFGRAADVLPVILIGDRGYMKGKPLFGGNARLFSYHSNRACVWFYRDPHSNQFGTKVACTVPFYETLSQLKESPVPTLKKYDRAKKGPLMEINSHKGSGL